MFPTHYPVDKLIIINMEGDVKLFCRFLSKQNLQKKYPLIHYHIYSGDVERVMEKLDKGLIDFGLFVGQVDIDKYDYMEFPTKDTWGVFMKKDSPNITMLTEYTKLITQYADMTEKFEQWEDSDLNDTELAYYLQVQSSITQKLLAVTP